MPRGVGVEGPVAEALVLGHEAGLRPTAPRRVPEARLHPPTRRKRLTWGQRGSDARTDPAGLAKETVWPGGMLARSMRLLGPTACDRKAAKRRTSAPMATSQMMVCATKHMTATASPSLPMFWATVPSLTCRDADAPRPAVSRPQTQKGVSPERSIAPAATCKGVSGRSVSSSERIFPHSEFLPTAVTR